MKIEKLDYFGRGVVHIDDKVSFVNKAISQEDVEIRIINENRKFNEADVVKINKKSDNRVIPKCKYYDKCGGCQIAHLKNEEQEKFKEEKIIELFKYNKIENLNIKNITYDNFYNYRNKVVFHVNGDKIGFYQKRTNTLVEVNECLLLDKRINELIPVLKKFIRTQRNLKKIVIRVGNRTREVMIGIVGDVHSYDFLLDKVDVLLINDKAVTTKNYISSYVGNKKYKVSLKSFFQINEIITEKIYNEVLGLIQKNKSKNVLDLYCGTGTIGIYIADYVDNVLGIEVVKDAVVDANFNKKLNNSKNISFIAGKVEDKINDVGIDFDTIIIDPPRSGLDKVVIQTILKINPKNIIYISCNPISLVRDIKLLINNYDIDYVKPFDMFPNTYHCESVTALERR